MKRIAIYSMIAGVVLALAVGAAFGQAKKEAFKYEDQIGVIKLKPSEPIHIACWMVIAGPDASLGTDTNDCQKHAGQNRTGWRFAPGLILRRGARQVWRVATLS